MYEYVCIYSGEAVAKHGYGEALRIAVRGPGVRLAEALLLALAAGRLLLPSLSVGYINSLTVGVKKKKTV